MSSEELFMLYAAYEAHRAVYRPKACAEHVRPCWVRLGPPAMSGSGVCHGCKDMPRPQPLVDTYS